LGDGTSGRSPATKCLRRKTALIGYRRSAPRSRGNLRSDALTFPAKAHAGLGRIKGSLAAPSARDWWQLRSRPQRVGVAPCSPYEFRVLFSVFRVCSWHRIGRRLCGLGAAGGRVLLPRGGLHCWNLWTGSGTRFDFSGGRAGLQPRRPRPSGTSGL